MAATYRVLERKAAELANELGMALTTDGNVWVFHCARTGNLRGRYHVPTRQLTRPGRDSERCADWSLAVRMAAKG